MTPRSTDDRGFLLTAPATAALAVVRLVGPGIGPFLARRFSRPACLGRAVHGLLRDARGQTLDDPVVVLVDAETADVTLHGGRWVVQSVLDLAARDGFAVVPFAAQPEPTDADGIADDVSRSLPSAPTAAAVRMLLSQRVAWEALRLGGDAAAWQAVLADPSGWWLMHPPTVAVVGPANVGKSTLANQLFGQPRSITADAPGTTRDWVGDVADLDGLAVVLVDTPGVRETDDPVEAAAIVAAGDRVRSADLTVLVLDRSRPLDDDARAVLAEHPTAVRVANKADVAAAWDGPTAIRTIATIGAGLDDLRAAVRRHFGCGSMDPHRPRWWTDRQRRDVARTIAHAG